MELFEKYMPTVVVNLVAQDGMSEICIGFTNR
jgi:hypothetical protein